jgi:hypothetical protein
MTQHFLLPDVSYSITMSDLDIDLELSDSY